MIFISDPHVHADGFMRLLTAADLLRLTHAIARCQEMLHLGSFSDLWTGHRAKGLDGIRSGATLIFPSGDVIGLSRDYQRAKHFAADRMS